jgi:CheY-like chemotaxis protein
VEWSGQSETAHRTGNEFLTKAAEEIRAPLNSILDLGELLLATGLTAQQRDYVDALLRSSHSLLGLLDRVSESASEEWREENDSSASLTSESSLKGLRVLLAEDNTVNQALAVRLLEQRGARVTVAGDGRQAVERFQESPFDLVLMDLHMPEMDGLKATELIRAVEPQGRPVPIIALTAHAGMGVRERCLEAGMNDYVNKPFSMQELCDVIERSSRTFPGANEVEAPLTLDRPALLSRVGGDEHLLADLAGLFVQDCPGRLAAVRQAAEAGDSVALQRSAHYLKGALGLFGVPDAVTAARELEMIGRSGDLGRAGEVYAVLERQTQRLTAALTASGPPLIGLGSAQGSLPT